MPLGGALRAALGAAALVAALPACGEREEVAEPAEAVELELVLDRAPSGVHAPLYAARGGGHLAERGVEIAIRQVAPPADPVELVATGGADAALVSEAEVLRARAEGLEVTSVAAIVQEPLLAILSLPSANVERAADLAGKRVATTGGGYEEDLLDAVLGRASVDPAAVERRAPVRDASAALVDGVVDAVLGAYRTVEAVELDLRGRDPAVLPIETTGFPPYDELVLAVREDALEDDPGALRSLVAALAEGTADLRRDPTPALRELLADRPPAEAELQRAIADATLPLFSPPEGQPYGWQEPPRWEALGRFLEEAGLVDRPVPAGQAFTNELLAGEGLE